MVRLIRLSQVKRAEVIQPFFINDVITLLNRMIPSGIWQHDHQDNNGDAHLKAGLVGPSETIPVINGTAGLSTWQNIFFCEFDGPRNQREIVVTVIGDNP